MLKETALSLLSFMVAVTFAAPENCAQDLPNVFENEKGSFEFQWEINTTTLSVQWQLPGSAYVGIGLGGAGGMAEVDMVGLHEQQPL